MESFALPGFSLICATSGRTTEIARLLQHLAKQTTQNFEIIILDQNQDNRLDDIIIPFRERISIKHHKINNSSLSRARNLGIGFASFEWLGFPDDDCWMGVDFIERLTAVAKRNRTADGLFVNWSYPHANHQDAKMFNFDEGELTLHDAFTLVSSICMYIKKSAVLKAGGFNEKMGLGADTLVKAGEDQDLILRIVSGAMRVYKVPDVFIHHPIGQRMWNKAFVTRIQGQGACDLYFHFKYFGFMSVIRLLTRWILGIAFNVLLLRRQNILWYWHKLCGGIRWSRKLS